MSLPTAPEPTHYSVKHRETLSKLTGAGLGTALVAWASAFGFGPAVTHALEISAPAIAVVIAVCGPYATRFLKHQVRYHGLRYILTRSKRFAASTIPGSESRIKTEQTIQKLELIINDLNDESAGFVNSLWQSKTP